MSEPIELPHRWRWASIEELCESIGGGTPSKKNRTFYGGNIPWLTIRDLPENEYEISDSTEHITPEAIAKSSTNLIEPNCVIIATRVGLGKVAINSVPVAINQDLRALRPTNRVSPEFLLFAILNSLHDILKFKQGTTVKGIKKEDLLSSKIPLPPLAVQERIVEILRQAEAIRHKQAEARHLIDQIISSAFKKFFGKAAVQMKPLGSLLLERPKYGTSERANSLGDGFPVLRIPNVLAGELDTSSMKYVPGLTDKEIRRLLVSPGDIVLVRTNGNRDYVGRCSVVPSVDQDYIFASYLMRLRPNTELVMSEYLDAFLRTQDARTQMLRTIPTSAGNYNINVSNLSRIEIPVPDKDIQRRFVHVIEQHRLSSAKVLHAEVTHKSLIGALRSRAFSGELTSEWETSNAEWIVDRQAFYERLPRLALLAVLLERNERAGRGAATLITALMKYIFLVRMEGEVRRRLYRFIPYHYGPCAMELYDDLKTLERDGLIAIENDLEQHKTSITLKRPDRVAAILEEEGRADDARITALENSEQVREAFPDPTMARLLGRRGELVNTLRADAASILNVYGELGYTSLLKTVYEKYPAYTKKSKTRRKHLRSR